MEREECGTLQIDSSGPSREAFVPAIMFLLCQPRYTRTSVDMLSNLTAIMTEMIMSLFSRRGIFVLSRTPPSDHRLALVGLYARKIGSSSNDLRNLLELHEDLSSDLLNGLKSLRVVHEEALRPISARPLLIRLLLVLIVLLNILVCLPSTLKPCVSLHEEASRGISARPLYNRPLLVVLLLPASILRLARH